MLFCALNCLGYIYALDPYISRGFVGLQLNLCNGSLCMETASRVTAML